MIFGAARLRFKLDYSSPKPIPYSRLPSLNFHSSIWIPIMSRFINFSRLTWIVHWKSIGPLIRLLRSPRGEFSLQTKYHTRNTTRVIVGWIIDRLPASLVACDDSHVTEVIEQSRCAVVQVGISSRGSPSTKLEFRSSRDELPTVWLFAEILFTLMSRRICFSDIFESECDNQPEVKCFRVRANSAACKFAELTIVSNQQIHKWRTQHSTVHSP